MSARSRSDILMNVRVPPPLRSAGFTRIELCMAVAVVGLLVIVVQRALLHARETARRQTCAEHLRQIHLGLFSYHDVYARLPPAAVWGPPRHAGDSPWPRVDDVAAVTFQNWAQLLLPHAPEQQLAGTGDPGAPIGSPGNAELRSTPPVWMRCPSDDFNTLENHYKLRSGQHGVVTFARGNYAINGGSQRMALFPGTSADPVPGGIHVETDRPSGVTAYWGNGIAGFNKSFAIDAFSNGLATTVAVDEVRAGIDPRDSRGVWALGQIGGSVTWAHGMNGDCGRPNSLWKRADDVAGCPELHQAYDAQRLVELGMPCCSYCGLNEQAAARSRHPGGVQVLTLDGAVHFISDDVDPGLWHVMHSRETPADLLGGALKLSPVDHQEVLTDEVNSRSPPVSAVSDVVASLTNGIGMEFVRLPPGRFLVGRPDEEVNAVFELDSTAHSHWVEITRPTWIATFEVTRAEYLAVMGQAPEGLAADVGGSRSHNGDQDRLPVSDVTWYEADEFCGRLSELPTESAAGRRYRLPTEAEWEYACRAGVDEPYIYIPERQPGDQTGENAMKDPPLPVTEVGSYPPNAFGLYDTRGNVWEWCRDWSRPGDYAISPERDPSGPPSGHLKVVRGADWLYVGQRCTLGFRATEPWLRSPFIGFRVVCEVSPGYGSTE